MAARITCPRVLATEQRYEVVVDTRSLKTRFVEFWPYCWGLLWGAIGGMCVGLGRVMIGMGKGGKIYFLAAALLLFIFGCIFVFSGAWLWIPIIMGHCHREPGVGLDEFNIRNMTAVPSSESWQVNSAFNATFSTWNRNNVARCFTTYRRIDVRVEYRGHVLLRQQMPLRFALKPQARRSFPIEVKSVDAAQLRKELGPVMQTEMETGHGITLNVFFDVRYLIADRRSKWETNGCVVTANSPADTSGVLKTMVAKDCYTF